MHDTVERYVSDQLTDRLVKSLTQVAESALSTMVDDIEIDPAWRETLERSLLQAVTQRVLRQMRTLDFDTIMAAAIDQGLERWRHKFIENFRTSGIADRAQNCELAVVDGAVVVTTALAAPRAEIQQDLDVQGTARVHDLVIRGSVNTDHESWQGLAQQVTGRVLAQLDQEWRESLVQQVLEHSRTQGIGFDHVMIGDEPLVAGNRLSAAITDTNIRSLGDLSELTVSGPAKLTNTVFVGNNRVGINSVQPDAALSIWDEEVALSLGKHSKDHAFVGTSRLQKLVLGVNRQQHLVIDEKGLVSVCGLRIDRWQIAHHDTVPGWSGTKGDIVFNSSPSEQAPMGWSCLGGYRWRELWCR